MLDQIKSTRYTLTAKTTDRLWYTANKHVMYCCVILTDNANSRLAVYDTWLKLSIKPHMLGNCFGISKFFFRRTAGQKLEGHLDKLFWGCDGVGGGFSCIPENATWLPNLKFLLNVSHEVLSSYNLKSKINLYYIFTALFSFRLKENTLFHLL